jgi:heterodisulfide reductase subunit B
MVDLMAEVENLRRKCIGCGKCSRVCPSLKHGGLDPMEMMISGEGDITQCIACGNCSQVCRRSNPYAVMRDLIALAKDVHPSEAFNARGTTTFPAENPVDPGWDGDEVSIMPGCIVNGKLPYLRHAARVAVTSVGRTSRELEGWTCCMHPVMVRELGEMVRHSYRLEMAKKAAGSELVTLCGGCSDELNTDNIACEHIIEFLHRHIGKLPRLSSGYKVSMEPGCASMSYASKMREVITALGCEVVNKTTGCCGKSAPVSVSLMAERQTESSGADFIVVGCPMCQVKYDSYEGGIPVMHISELVALATGDKETLRFHKIPLGI